MRKGVGVETIWGYAVAPDTTFTGLTMYAGNTAKVRSYNGGRPARVIDWAYKTQATSGYARIATTKTESTKGITDIALQNAPLPLLPYAQTQPLYANDDLTLQVTGSATVGDYELMMVTIAYPEELGNMRPNVMSAAEISAFRRANPKAVMQTMVITVALGTGGTTFSGEAAMSTATHALKNDENYAIIGYKCSAASGGLRFRSNSDFGSLGFGFPGTTRHDITKDYFLNLDLQYGIGVPVFNTLNLAQFYVDGAQDENGADVILTLFVLNLTPDQVAGR